MTDYGKLLVLIIGGIIVVSIFAVMWREAGRELGEGKAND